MVDKGGRVSFDYETNMLKPDSKDAEIICCAVCWQGKKTISFPWTNKTSSAMKRLLVSERLKKVGANIKFEDRWTKAVLGVDVVGWEWDTMQSAHVLDNRPEITSVKFQAFVRLGFGSYDDHIKPFLESVEPGGNSKNRINEVDRNDLLLYCGLDSLLEYKIALHQMKEAFGDN
jgi:DNA polymerase I-like protein with 3'-5' exonuclease and polymerase domains